jgi:hypothetical protein
VGLIRSDRGRFPDRRESLDPAVGAECLDRGAQIIDTVTDVRAQTDRDPRIRLLPLRG